MIWIVQPVNLSDRLSFSWSLCSLFRLSRLNVSTQFCHRNAPSNYWFHDYGYYWSRKLRSNMLTLSEFARHCAVDLTFHTEIMRPEHVFIGLHTLPTCHFLSEMRADSVEPRLFPEVESRHMLVLHLKHIHGFCWGPMERESRCDKSQRAGAHSAAVSSDHQHAS